ncbi:MAG TPA: hypothetical protein VLH79_06830 [Chthonomonadales bacterium]|nr:hypothetical protein [Chthonomonadales bacterium]
MSLEALKISEAPAAFAEFAQKHNALVALLDNIETRGGMQALVTAAKIILKGGSGTEGTAVEVVQGSDGKLVKVVKHSTAGTPTAFPPVLKVVNGSTSVLVDSTGVTITTSGGKVCSIAFASIARDMSIRTISVCDAGTTKSMDILASAAY